MNDPIDEIPQKNVSLDKCEDDDFDYVLLVDGRSLKFTQSEVGAIREVLYSTRV